MSEAKYVTRHKLPTPHEREILTILQEECAEIIVRISKALRFGLSDGYPGRAETNRAAIGREIGDLDVLIAMARDAGLFCETDRIRAREEKLEKLNRFMQTSPKQEAARER